MGHRSSNPDKKLKKGNCFKSRTINDKLFWSDEKTCYVANAMNSLQNVITNKKKTFLILFSLYMLMNCKIVIAKILSTFSILKEKKKKTSILNNLTKTKSEIFRIYSLNE